jgi:hypothetical protein
MYLLFFFQHRNPLQARFRLLKQYGKVTLYFPEQQVKKSKQGSVPD